MGVMMVQSGNSVGACPRCCGYFSLEVHKWLLLLAVHRFLSAARALRLNCAMTIHQGQMARLLQWQHLLSMGQRKGCLLVPRPGLVQKRMYRKIGAATRPEIERLVERAPSPC